MSQSAAETRKLVGIAPMKSSIICEKNLRQGNSSAGTSAPGNEIVEAAVWMMLDNDPFSPHRIRLFGELIEPVIIKTLS